MTDDITPPGDDPTVPPIRDVGDDPTLIQPIRQIPSHGPGTSGAPIMQPSGPSQPIWLLPFLIGAGVVLIAGLIAFFVTRDGGETQPPPTVGVVEPPVTTEPPASTEPPVTTAPPTTVSETTVPESDASCADGYIDVAAVPFGSCSQGAIVAETQELLNLSRGAGLQLDGFYGPGSETAVRSAQSELGFPVDGIVTQALLDALTPPTPPPLIPPTPPTPPPTPPTEDDFAPAAPGNVRVNGSETPIIRTCTTFPGPGFSYFVTSYVFGESGSAVDLYSFRGGAVDAALGDLASLEYRELGQGFGFTVLEGDFVSTITVNPVEGTPEQCLGTVVETNGSAQTRERSIIAICETDGETRLATSEPGFVGVTGDVASGSANTQLSFNDESSSVFALTGATTAIDGATVRLTTSAVRGFFEAADQNVSFVIEYPTGPHPACF